MTVQIDWTVAGDADLVGAATAGDRVAFAGIYDRYADRLYDFCVGMVGDRDAAADCVQEASAGGLSICRTLRDPAKLRPWLYSIARHQALRALRARRRETTSDGYPTSRRQMPVPTCSRPQRTRRTGRSAEGGSPTATAKF